MGVQIAVGHQHIDARLADEAEQGLFGAAVENALDLFHELESRENNLNVA